MVHTPHRLHPPISRRPFLYAACAGLAFAGTYWCVMGFALGIKGLEEAKDQWRTPIEVSHPASLGMNKLIHSSSLHRSVVCIQTKLPWSVLKKTVCFCLPSLLDLTPSPRPFASAPPQTGLILFAVMVLNAAVDVAIFNLQCPMYCCCSYLEIHTPCPLPLQTGLILFALMVLGAAVPPVLLLCLRYAFTRLQALVGRFFFDKVGCGTGRTAADSWSID